MGVAQNLGMSLSCNKARMECGLLLDSKATACATWSKNAILRVGNELCVFIGNDRQVFSGPTVSASRSIGVQRFSGCNKLILEMMCNTPISFLHRLGV